MLALESIKTRYESSQLSELFRILIEEFCHQAAADGIVVRGFSEEPLGKFKQLPPHVQIHILSNFESFYEICQETHKEGRPLRDTRSILWVGFKKRQLRPCSDLMDKIAEDDVVEVYDANFIQIMRNLKFLQICSYPLDEIFCSEFQQLFRRPPEVLQGILQFAEMMARGQVTNTITTNLPPHVLEEIYSVERRRFQIHQKILSPLFDRTNRPVAAVASLQAVLIGKSSS